MFELAYPEAWTSVSDYLKTATPSRDLMVSLLDCECRDRLQPASVLSRWETDNATLVKELLVSILSGLKAALGFRSFGETDAKKLRDILLTLESWRTAHERFRASYGDPESSL